MIVSIFEVFIIVFVIFEFDLNFGEHSVNFLFPDNLLNAALISDVTS